MDRRQFVKRGCVACVGSTILGSLISSCHPTQYISGTLYDDGIYLSKDDFSYRKGEGTGTKDFIIVQNDKLDYPIYVSKITETEYSALWMKCTHQGGELLALGDHLICPSHGSEFNNKGTVSHGPAENSLRSFPVSLDGNKINIDLRKA